MPSFQKRRGDIRRRLLTILKPNYLDPLLDHRLPKVLVRRQLDYSLRRDGRVHLAPHGRDQPTVRHVPGTDELSEHIDVLQRATDHPDAGDGVKVQDAGDVVLLLEEVHQVLGDALDDFAVADEGVVEAGVSSR